MSRRTAAVTEQEWKAPSASGTRSISKDGDTVYVNLYLPCTLEMPDGRLQIRQTQTEKDPEQIKIQVKGKIRTLALRKPGWAKEDLEICVQGNQADPIVDENGYIRIQADFEAGSGDKCKISVSSGG